MSNQFQPQIDICFEDLSVDPKERTEMLIDILGRYVFWLRNCSVKETSDLGESEQLRDDLGSIFREKYDKFAELSAEHRQIASKVAEATLDRFILLLLSILGGIGTDKRLGSDHAVRFALDLEILEVAGENFVEKDTISRNGKRFLANYFGRWLNAYSEI